MYVHHGVHDFIFNFVGTLEASQVGLSSPRSTTPLTLGEKNAVQALQIKNQTFAGLL